MKKFSVASVCFAIAVFFSSCPYGALVSLGSSTACSIDSALLGEWFGLNSEAENDTAYYNIIPFNNSEYVIEAGQIKDGKIKIDVPLRAYETKMASVRLMNITEAGKNNYSFYAFKTADGKIKVNYISDKFIKQQFATGKELNAFVAKNINNKDLFEGDVTLVKYNR